MALVAFNPLLMYINKNYAFDLESLHLVHKSFSYRYSRTSGTTCIMGHATQLIDD